MAFTPDTKTNPSPPPASPVIEAEDGRDSPDLPLTMTASTVLMTLPRDATAALAASGGFPQEKVVVSFKPVGSAPPLKQSSVYVGSAQRFDSVVAFLRKKLRVKETESVFLYVNSVFAPSLDEIVGNLWQVREEKGWGRQVASLLRSRYPNYLPSPICSTANITSRIMLLTHAGGHSASKTPRTTSMLLIR